MLSRIAFTSIELNCTNMLCYYFFYCAWCIYIPYSVPTSFLKSAASAHLQEIRSTQNTWRHFCEFDAAQPPATQPVCEQVSSGVFAYAKCDGWTTPTRNENPKEHVIAMFCSLLVFFSNLFLGVVERRIGIPKHPFALRTGFEWFVMDASHGAGHTLLKCFFSTNMPGISAGCDVDSVHGLLVYTYT